MVRALQRLVRASGKRIVRTCILGWISIGKVVKMERMQCRSEIDSFSCIAEKALCDISSQALSVEPYSSSRKWTLAQWKYGNDYGTLLGWVKHSQPTEQATKCNDC